MIPAQRSSCIVKSEVVSIKVVAIKVLRDSFREIGFVESVRENSK